MKSLENLIKNWLTEMITYGELLAANDPTRSIAIRSLAEKNCKAERAYFFQRYPKYKKLVESCDLKDEWKLSDIITSRVRIPIYKTLFSTQIWKLHIEETKSWHDVYIEKKDLGEVSYSADLEIYRKEIKQRAELVLNAILKDGKKEFVQRIHFNKLTEKRAAKSGAALEDDVIGALVKIFSQVYAQELQNEKIFLYDLSYFNAFRFVNGERIYPDIDMYATDMRHRAVLDTDGWRPSPSHEIFKFCIGFE